MLIAFLIFAAGVFCVVLGVKQAREAGEVASTFILPVSRVVSGLTALQGRAQSTNTSIAPLSGKSCVYWHITLMEGRGRSTREVANEFFPEEDFCFNLEDDSGSLPVLAGGAQLLIASEDHSTDQSDWGISESGMEWVAGAGRNWRHTRFWESPLAITEERLEDGAMIYVLGTASAPSELPAGELERPEVGSSGAVIWKGNPKGDFVISDKEPAQTARAITAGGTIGIDTGFYIGIGALLIIGGVWFFWLLLPPR